MVKQIRDYVLEGRLLRESKEQKNEINENLANKINDAISFSDNPDEMYEAFHFVIVPALKKANIKAKDAVNLFTKDSRKKLGRVFRIGHAYTEQDIIDELKIHKYESSQKNEEKEFTIKLVTPFGKAKVCSWKANSVDAAVKEFLDANPAYRENKKGAVIAESAQKKESLGDEIVQEVKEEVKDGVKDLVQQDVDAKLNGEITPKDYQANFEEDVDDDSDGIFGDELANAEPDEPEQANESVDEKSLKSFLKSEYDRALKQAKSFSGTNNNFSNFYEGYAAAMKAIQEKFKL